MKKLCAGLTGPLQPNLTNGWAKVPFSNSAYRWAGAGFLMSSSDAARFGAAMIAPSSRGLSDKAHALLFTPVAQATKGPPPSRSRRHHVGAAPGGCFMLMVYPDQKLAIAVTGNVMR